MGANGRDLRFGLADMLLAEKKLPVEIGHVNGVQVNLTRVVDTRTNEQSTRGG